MWQPGQSSPISWYICHLSPLDPTNLGPNVGIQVGNTALFEVSDWASNINLAKDAHIDAFALNIAYDWPHNNEALDKAFQAAAGTGFKLFFSFDYAGNGPWPAGEVMDLIRKYGSHSAYFQHQDKPFVSTFEGPAQAEDWVIIKQTTPCFFMPDWSSLGAGPASTAAGGVADGLFSKSLQLPFTILSDRGVRLPVTNIGILSSQRLGCLAIRQQ